LVGGGDLQGVFEVLETEAERVGHRIGSGGRDFCEPDELLDERGWSWPAQRWEKDVLPVAVA